MNRSGEGSKLGNGLGNGSSNGSSNEVSGSNPPAAEEILGVHNTPREIIEG
ncbi:unannotated protein [freshwater metagenome]|uniref:Unannotated protein n=1 Tax=freshwater metagenome TaxID=449393 RepID=A0A6J7BNU7_9ZZZZ